MRSLPAIEALYTEIDKHLDSLRASALAAGRATDVARIEEKQRLNDQAYFILCWGQLEAEVDEACRELIRRRKASPNWSERRAWDMFNPDEKRLSGLSFEDRVGLLLDRNAGPGSPWAMVMNHYGVRNQIAHGKLRPQRIDVAAVVGELYRIRSALQP